MPKPGADSRRLVTFDLRHDFQVVLALQRPPLITRLALGANQAVWTTTAKRREIKVAAIVADATLQMTAFSLIGAVSPGGECRIGEKPVELAAMTT